MSYKELDENGKTVIEFKSTPAEITSTLKSIKSVFEENEFIKNHISEYSSLSKREIEVLSLLGKGKKHQDIADNLFISIHTVRDHIKNIKQKLDVKTNTELLKYFNAFIKNRLIIL